MKEVLVPGLLAHRIRDQIRAYLGTTYNVRDPTYRKDLDEFLSGSDGIFKGPWIDIKLPFRSAEPSAKLPIAVSGKFPPYLHQLRAWTRLNSKGQMPKSTIVATGTGSGKTECFLNPILDHASRHKKYSGTVALIFYPMNALAFDQARRIAEMIFEDPDRLHGVTAGLLVGENTEDDAPRKGKKSMGPNYIIDDRSTIIENPPHLLLTNYKMMDLMLLKPEFAPLWDRIKRLDSPDQSGPSLQYLVLDEMHTYDGARGADVGLLVRRLKAKLGIGEGQLACVGTSATLSNSEEGKKRLLTFAKRLTGETFDQESVVTEDRLRPDEVFKGIAVVDSRVPEDTSVLQHSLTESLQELLARISNAWIGSPVETALELGRHVMSLSITRAIIDIAAEGPKTEEELILSLKSRGFVLTPRQLGSFLALIAHSRRKLTPVDRGPAIELPLFHIRVQLWLREMTDVLGRVGGTGKAYLWNRPTRPGVPVQGMYLPPVFCEECGNYGFATREVNGVLERRDVAKIHRARTDKSPTVRYLFPWTAELPEIEQGLGVSSAIGVCRGCGAIDQNRFDGPCHQCATPYERWLAFAALSRPRGPNARQKELRFCPSCHSKDSLKTLSARMNTLTSITSGEIFLSRLTPMGGKRLLVFSEAVQDASHRAGYLNARTYRFNFRTAIQSVVADADDDLLIGELAKKLLPYWTGKLGGLDAAVAALTPKDLMSTTEHEAYWEGKKDSLRVLLEKRILWEIYIEYCLRSQVGRTLEKTLSSAAYWCDAISKVKLEKAYQLVVNQHQRGDIQDAGPNAFENFWLGLVQRLLQKGAISLPDVFDNYRREGKRFQLSRRFFKWISGLPSGRVSEGMEVGQLPNFPSTNPNSDVFDYLGAPQQGRSWFQDWYCKCFSTRGASSLDITRGLQAVFASLSETGILNVQTEVRGGYKNYGLSFDSVRVSKPVTQLRCDKCRDPRQIASKLESQYAGLNCKVMRCDGRYKSVDPDFSSEFYQMVYGNGLVARLFAEEHTGMLARSDREKIEVTFKRKDGERRPSDVNTLSCTSTLEMGIDVGDLSATVAAGLPKSPVNFQQQIGRAGRTTGSAFIAALAQARPRDLLFFDDPRELIAGHIEPPGCFLDAPDILRRQYTAFVLESNYGRLKGKRKKLTVKGVLEDLAQIEGSGFWSDFEDIVTGPNSIAFQSFKEACHLSDIEEETWARMSKEWLTPAAVGERCRLVQNVMNMFRDFEVEKSQLEAGKRELSTELSELEGKVRLTEDDKERIEKIRNELGAVYADLEALGAHEGLHALLAKKGFLPNYAFSEDAVELISYRRLEKPRDGKIFVQESFERPAGSAIRDLAPGNTFYGGGQKVGISTLDLGKDSKRYIEAWNICQDCGHLEAGHEEHANKKCPSCTGPRWGDAGARIKMVRLRRVKSVLGDEADGDESEKRIAESYKTRKLFAGSAGEIWGIDDDETYLGLEFISKMTMREVNFGFSDNILQSSINIAGIDYPTGFTVCYACGRAQPRGGDIKHTSTCPRGRASPRVLGRSVGPQPAAAPVLDPPLLLYREITSEAVRVHVPCRALRSEVEVASYQAALVVGLRKHFGGTPDHIIVEQDHGINPDDGLDYHALMIFDTVPGGSGFMKELSSKDSFFKIVGKGLEALKTCACANNPERDDGCIRCVYSAVSQRDIANVSRKRAVEILEQVLGRKNDFRKLETKEVRAPRVTESKLEDMLCEVLDGLQTDQALVNALAGAGIVVSSTTKNLATEGVGIIVLKDIESETENTWRIELQRTIRRSNEGLVTRPDFILTKVVTEGTNRTRPIALFTDGFAYHAGPNSEDTLTDDFQKRTKLSLGSSGKPMRVWSLTWSDVRDFASPNVSSELCVFGRDKIAGSPIIQINQLTMLLRYLATDVGDRPNGGAGYKYGWDFVQKLILSDPAIKSYSSTSIPKDSVELLQQLSISFDLNPHYMGWDDDRSCCALIQSGNSENKFNIAVVNWDVSGLSREQDRFERSWKQLLATHNLMGLVSGGVACVVSRSLDE